MPKTKMPKTSKEARDYISHKIKLMMKEGMPQDRAIATAYSMARKKGFGVPIKGKGRKTTKKKMARKKKSKKSKGK